MGFEPTLPFRVNTLSKRAPSATRPSLRRIMDIRLTHSRSEYTLWRMLRMSFNDFIRERRYLNNVSPATISWYTHAFKWLPFESPRHISIHRKTHAVGRADRRTVRCSYALRSSELCLPRAKQGKIPAIPDKRTGTTSNRVF